MSITHFAYWLFLGVIIISLFVSKKVYPKMKLLSRHEMSSFLPVAAFFIVWDYLVTDVWWHFNPKYVVGATVTSVTKLPLEEVLFFFVVPYALLVFVKNLQVVIQSEISSAATFLFKKKYRFFLKCVLLGLTGFFVYSHFWYSATVTLLLSLSDFAPLQKKVYQIGMIFTITMTLLFNFYLTYLPVVMYTELYKTGIMIGTIPIEDFGYAIILYLWIVKGFDAATATRISQT